MSQVPSTRLADKTAERLKRFVRRLENSKRDRAMLIEESLWRRNLHIELETPLSEAGILKLRACRMGGDHGCQSYEMDCEKVAL